MQDSCKSPKLQCRIIQRVQRPHSRLPPMQDNDTLFFGPKKHIQDLWTVIEAQKIHICNLERQLIRAGVPPVQLLQHIEPVQQAPPGTLNCKHFIQSCRRIAKGGTAASSAPLGCNTITCNDWGPSSPDTALLHIVACLNNTSACRSDKTSMFRG